MALFGKKKPTLEVRQLVSQPQSVPRPDSATVPWSRLLPMIRRLDTYAYTQGAEYYVTRPVAPFLIEVLAFDTPEAMAVLNTTMAEVNQAPIQEYFDTASNNMGALALTGQYYAAGGQPISACQVETPVGYAISWATQPDRVAEMFGADGRTGDLVVIPCDRDLLYVCAADDLAMVESTLDTVWQQTWSNQYPGPISPAAYRMDQGRLVPWQSPVQGPIATKQNRALAYLSYAAYRAQYQWLVADNYKRLWQVPDSPNGEVMAAGEPIFGTKPDPDPGYLSMSPLVPYEPNDDVLICPLDAVSLTESAQRNMIVPYQVFVDVCANMVSQEDSLPLPMTRVRGWPTEEQWTQLSEHAITSV